MDEFKDQFENLANLQDEEETDSSHHRDEDDDEKAPSEQVFAE